MSDIEEQIAAIVNMASKLFPRLMPESYCSHTTIRTILPMVERQCKRQEKSSGVWPQFCELCGHATTDEESENSCYLSPQWNLRIERKSIQFESIQVICKSCFKLRNCHQILDRVCACDDQPDLRSEVLLLASHFCEVNGRSESTTDELGYLREALSLSTCIGILIKNVKKLHLLTPLGTVLTVTEFEKLLESMVQKKRSTNARKTKTEKTRSQDLPVSASSEKTKKKRKRSLAAPVSTGKVERNKKKERQSVS